MRAAAACLLLATAAQAHSNLISPRPRNAIDGNDPRWEHGLNSPDMWQGDLGPVWGQACACRNGSHVCDIGQTCLWMSVGCSLGCKECDGGQDGHGGTNPNSKDRCASGLKPWKNNDPMKRTFNRNCTGSCIGSDEDWTRFNPWRAPGAAPVYDSCGRAGGGPKPTAGKGEYVDTEFAKFGQLGSTLPTQPSGAVWKAGAVVEALWSVRANHGGGWQFRLCPLGEELNEACFQKTPVPFAGNSRMMMSNGTMLELNSTFVSEGTLPAGSTWQMNPIPMTRGGPNLHDMGYQFEPPCYDPTPPRVLGQGICSGEWMNNITIYDSLRVPAHLKAGEYVLGFRCEFSCYCVALRVRECCAESVVLCLCLSPGHATAC